MDFRIINGEILKSDEINLSYLLYNNPLILSQKFWYGYGGLPLFFENLLLLNSQIKVLHLPVPDLLKNHRELYRIIKRMLNKNKFYRSGFVNIQLFWHGTKHNLLIDSSSFSGFEFPYFKQGLLINYTKLKKYSENPFGKYAFYNKPLWESVENGNIKSVYSNSIFLNDKNVICDCVNANIFMIKDKVLYTPALSTGCYEDSLRAVILEIAHSVKLKIHETITLRKENVLAMDEIFLAGEEYGIHRVLGVDKKRFVHHFSNIIHEKVNEYLKGKVV